MPGAMVLISLLNLQRHLIGCDMDSSLLPGILTNIGVCAPALLLQFALTMRLSLSHLLNDTLMKHSPPFGSLSNLYSPGVLQGGAIISDVLDLQQLTLCSILTPLKLEKQ